MEKHDVCLCYKGRIWTTQMNFSTISSTKSPSSSPSESPLLEEINMCENPCNSIICTGNSNNCKKC